MAVLEQLAFDALSHPVLVVDPGGKILSANRAMLAYLGMVTGKSWDGDRIVGLDVEELHPPAAHPGMRDRLRQVLASDTPLPPRTNRVGNTLFLTHDKTLRDSEGRVVGVMMEKIPVSVEP